MSDVEPDAMSDEPITVERLVSDLRELGLSAGDTVFVHSSLSALGWVCGGPAAVVDALQQTVSAEGTLVLPTFTGDYSDPGGWQDPPVPDEWEPTIRETMPAFRPGSTPCPRIGAIPNTFRSYPGVVRSDHPVVSFAAWGADAEAIVLPHPDDEPLGEGTPLARLYDHDASVLMLGTDYETATSCHLAEYRGEFPKEHETGGGPAIRDGERVWLEFDDVALDTADFPAVGEAFERERPDAVAVEQVGVAESRLVDQRALVDFAASWFGENRPESLEQADEGAAAPAAED
ncbi:aminoglycoside N(3)-acetyltransferase [Haloarchaeobius sp. FL176]|uniref:aminoglycoside N(3)-acetyltransferase n=1 Tax=Haloarchaeobius sp. FL176 TaxID=2967129 RepID=UPI00214895C8|nr:AAC(3) family N-acetyltransferase [Haloarchaeobius sp. FL176]